MDSEAFQALVKQHSLHLSTSCYQEVISRDFLSRHPSNHAAGREVVTWKKDVQFSAFCLMLPRLSLEKQFQNVLLRW